MRIAVLGGSFNPFHIGHAMAGESVIKELGYDKVIFIPTYIPPHKKITGTGASASHRLGMLKAFCMEEGRLAEGFSGKDGSDISFLFDSCEIDRGGVSYTWETLEYIINKCKGVIEGRPGLIIGEEIAAEFNKWKNPEKIAAMADIIIVPRIPDYSRKDAGCYTNKPSGDYEGDFSVPFDENSFGYPYKKLSSPVVSVSSTDIRNRIANGKSYKYLVPSPVFKYIEEHNLYR